MPLEKKPFVSYTLDQDRPPRDVRVISVKLNLKEYDQLRYCMTLLEQPKQSTALKQLADIGARVVLNNLTGEIIGICLNNRRRNKRTGAAVSMQK